MKILLIALDQTYDFIVPLLENEGHEVRLLTRCERIPLIHSPKTQTYILEQIQKFDPDLVINAIASIFLPSSSNYTYIGNTWASARLETHKWETRQKAEKLGWKLPTVLTECDMNAMPTYEFLTYLKPKGLTTHSSSFQVPADINYNGNFPANTQAYVEEEIDYAVGAICFFTISNGSYHITRTMANSVGEGDGNHKNMDGGPDWTESYTIYDLPTELETAFLAKCRTWLDYAVTLGGSYEGIIEAGITSSNEFYWFEQNSRPGNMSEAFKSGTVQDWLEGLTTDPTKSPPVRYKTET